VGVLLVGQKLRSGSLRNSKLIGAVDDLSYITVVRIVARIRLTQVTGPARANKSNGEVAASLFALRLMSGAAACPRP